MSHPQNSSILELTPEQIRTLTLAEKDEWWLKNIYRGDMPQLNLRSALTGMLLGGVLSLTNLYIGIKTGWTLGVGISSVILSFAIFRVMAKLNLGSEMSILENNAMQSIATSAGYMTAPLMASMPAYMMVTGKVVPMWQTFWWIVVLSLLGVLFAFPLKKRYINDEQLPFPEGYAAGVVLQNLHTDQGGKDGVFKAKLLMGGMALSALIETMRNGAVMTVLKLKALTLPEYWDAWIYKFVTPAISGIPLNVLTVQWETSIVMMGTGGLMSMKTAMSILLGGFINYFLLAPMLIQAGVIPEAKFKAICPLVSQFMVFGNERNFVVALITIDPDAATAWAAENELPGASYGDIVRHEKLRATIGEYVEELNGKLNRWETIKKWEILDHDLSIESGELTPSLKVKRNVVEDRNKERIAAFYS